MNIKFEEGSVFSSDDVCKYAMDLHYPQWDTSAREESDIPARIEKYQRFVLRKINVQEIEEPPFYIDDDKVEEYSEMNISTMPPIVLSSKYNNMRYIIDGSHRYKARIEKGDFEILAFIPTRLMK